MRSNLKKIAAASALAVTAMATPAFGQACATVPMSVSYDNCFNPGTAGAATTGGGTYAFLVSGDPTSGPVQASYIRSGATAGTWVDLFAFRIDQVGLGSGDITTTTQLALGPTDADLLSVIFNNGVTDYIVPLSSILTTESGSLINVPIFFGNTNYLRVEFLSRGNQRVGGGYGGTLTFAPVPEPGTWALMLLGFAGMGFMLRRPRKQAVRVKYAF